MPTVTRNHFIS